MMIVMHNKNFQIVILITAALAFNCINICAQGQYTRPYKQNQFYLELGGNGIIYSVNYERLLSENFSLRGGIGISPTLGLVDGIFIFMPVTGSILLGSSTSKLEIGLGMTYFSGKETEFLGNAKDGQSESELFMTGILGYRYLSSGGLIVRVVFIPFFNPDKTNDSKFLPWGGLSFGYSF